MSLEFSFHHTHFYVNHLRPLEEYKKIENLFTEFEAKVSPKEAVGVARDAFASLGGEYREHTPCNQDIVEQLICGFGLRIIGHRDDAAGGGVRSVLLTSVDEGGAKFLVSAVASPPSPSSSSSSPLSPVSIFKRENVEEFFRLHNGKQGIAVLCFRVEEGGCEKVLARYQAHHPALVTPEGLTTYEEGGKTVRILEVFAYYARGGGVGDGGTRIRFVESAAPTHDIIPGLTRTHAKVHMASFDICRWGLFSF